MLYNYDDNTDAPPMLLGLGNGFPPEAYAPFMQEVAQGYCALAHLNRQWWQPSPSPDTLTSWHVLADDLIADIEKHHLAPVVALGHSMSGVALCYAAVDRPDLFRAIVLLDPVYFPRHLVWLGYILNLLGLQPNKKRVEGALRRRHQWDSQDAAFERFRKSGFFKNVPDEPLELYTRGVTKPINPQDLADTPQHDTKSVGLAYPREWEAKIFSTLPVDEWAYPPQIKVPCLVLGGAKSDVFLPAARQLWQRMRPDIPLHTVEDAGHLLPMEKPVAVAKHIRGFLAKLGDDVAQ